MAKTGIKIISDSVGIGREIQNGDSVRIRYDVSLNRGEILAADQVSTFVFGDREMVAGFRYGLEGMRVGGTRAFKASPHLCYRDKNMEKIPKNAVLIFSVKSVEVIEKFT